MEKFDINLNLYRSFYYVAKYEGFTKASKHVTISQSSLSYNIKCLEDMLGHRLFYRNQSNIVMTKEGKKLYRKIEDIIGILKDEKDLPEINIGCLRFIADNYLDDSVIKLKEKYDRISISFTFSNTNELIQKLKKEEVDIVITRNPLFYRFDRQITLEKICDVSNVLVCSKDYYDREKEKMGLEDYVYKMILPDASEKRRKIDAYLMDQNVLYDVEVELPSSNLLKCLILKGAGIGYINRKYVSEEIEKGEVVALKQFKNIPIDDITVIFNSSNKNKYVNSFIEILKQTIGKINN